ncbi:lyase family protein [Paramagnetospirillum marisnigri]
MSTTRTERDSFGAIEVPADRLWGAQTQRSLEHFAISNERMPEDLIVVLARVKFACAGVNRNLGLLSEDKATAIIAAADEARTASFIPTMTSILASRPTMSFQPPCISPPRWAWSAESCRRWPGCARP